MTINGTAYRDKIQVIYKPYNLNEAQALRIMNKRKKLTVL